MVESTSFKIRIQFEKGKRMNAIDRIGDRIGKKKRPEIVDVPEVPTQVQRPDKPIDPRKSALEKKLGIIKGPSETGKKLVEARKKGVPGEYEGTVVDYVPPGEEKPKKDIYDIQRQKIQAEAAREQERRQEALQRRMAAQGLGGQVAEKQMRGISQDIERATAGGLSDIDIAESMAEEAKEATLQGQEWQEKMFGLSTQFQKDMFGAKSQHEKDMIKAKFQNDIEKLGMQHDFEMNFLGETQGFNVLMAELMAGINKDFLSFQSDIASQKQTQNLQNEQYFNLGASGQEIDEDELEKLKLTNPQAYEAYKAGQAGMTLEEYQADKAKEDEKMKALIAALDPNLIDKINGIFEGLWPEEDITVGPQVGPTMTTTNKVEIGDAIASGEMLTPEQLAIVEANPSEFDMITDTSFEDMDIVTFHKGFEKIDGSSKNRWILSPEAETWAEENNGKLYKAANGKVYQVVGTHEPTSKKSTAGIKFKDVETGEVVVFTQGGKGKTSLFPEAEIEEELSQEQYEKDLGEWEFQYKKAKEFGPHMAEEFLKQNPKPEPPEEEPGMTLEEWQKASEEARKKGGREYKKWLKANPKPE
jgi:hypothetical protein